MATVITNAGLAIASNRIKNGDTGATEPNYLAWGTGVTTAAVTDTALETASAESRVAGTSTQETTTATNDTYRVVGTLTSASTQDITELGLFDASTAGNLFMHADFPAYGLNASDGIQFTVNVVLS